MKLPRRILVGLSYYLISMIMYVLILTTHHNISCIPIWIAISWLNSTNYGVNWANGKENGMDHMDARRSSLWTIVAKYTILWNLIFQQKVSCYLMLKSSIDQIDYYLMRVNICFFLFRFRSIIGWPLTYSIISVSRKELRIIIFKSIIFLGSLISGFWHSPPIDYLRQQYRGQSQQKSGNEWNGDSCRSHN